MRTLLAIVLATFLSIGSANAATLGDAFQLTENIKVATKQRCPESKQGDLESLMAALKCQSIDMVVGGFGVKLAQLANRLMDQCVTDLKGGKNFKDCKATNENYKAVVLTGDDERSYLALKARYETLPRDFPVLRR